MNTIKSIKDELEYKLARCELSSNDPNAHVILTLDELREVIKELNECEEKVAETAYDDGRENEEYRCQTIRDAAEKVLRSATDGRVAKAIKILGKI